MSNRFFTTIHEDSPTFVLANVLVPDLVSLIILVSDNQYMSIGRAALLLDADTGTIRALCDPDKSVDLSRTGKRCSPGLRGGHDGFLGSTPAYIDGAIEAVILHNDTTEEAK